MPRTFRGLPSRQQDPQAEYLIPDALAKGADTLVSIGRQSNHTRQVAAVAAKLGLKCRLVKRSGWSGYPVYDKVGNILLSRIRR